MAEQSTIKRRLDPREGRRRIEINPPSQEKSWQRPRVWVLVYLVLLVVGFYLTQAPLSNIQELPYSAFLEHLDKNEVKEVVIAGQVIHGTLTTATPRPVSRNDSSLCRCTTTSWRSSCADMA